VSKSPLEELRDRLDQYGSRVAKVTLNHNPVDGGPRTLVELFDSSDEKIAEWDDWMLPNDAALAELQKRWAEIGHGGGGYVRSFTVSVPRRRTREKVQP